MNTTRLTHSGNLLLIGFGAMLAMMTLLVVLSVKQELPMVSKNYYEQELRYQQTIDERSRALPYASGFSIRWTPDSVVLQLPPALSRELQAGNAGFYCPSAENMDRNFALKADAEGRYNFPRKALPGAGYIVRISLQAKGLSYYYEIKPSY